MFTQPGAHFGYGPQLIGNFGLRRVRRGKVEYATVGVGRDELDANGGKRIRRSIPGGYAGKGESANEAASRELYEELGIRVGALGSISVRQVVIPPHPFWKNTIHAWTREEFTFAYSEDNPELGGVEINVQDVNEVVEARWMGVEEIQQDGDFLGAHRKQILENEAVLRRG
jgi:8-oxo-dGTP pyrophosphatase MutT (NUDIX family)